MAQSFYFSTREADLTLKPAWVLHRRVPGQAGLLRKTLSRKQNKTKSSRPASIIYHVLGQWMAEESGRFPGTSYMKL